MNSTAERPQTETIPDLRPDHDPDAEQARHAITALRLAGIVVQPGEPLPVITAALWARYADHLAGRS